MPNTPDWKPESDEAYRRRMRLKRFGQAMMIAGLVVVAVHWLLHVGVWSNSQPTLLVDFVSGYPMGVLIAVIGAILASQRPKPRRKPGTK